MRKSIVILAVLTLAVTLSSLTASASSSSVTMSAPTTGTITFTANSGNTIMTVAGPFSGLAVSGTGSFAGVSSFTLSGGPVTFAPTGSDPGDYAATMGTLTLALSNGFTSTLTNLSLDQVGKVVTLSGTMSSGGQVTVIIDLPFGTPLSKLPTVHNPELGTFSAGEANGGVTPEPSTMLLFGSGLLVFAAVLRRKVLV